MKYRYSLVDVFTDRPFSGNQLAVFPEASGLTESSMQSIARELDLSETAFVQTPDETKEADFRVRIFTPVAELPMAGHPTIGTAFVLAQEGRISKPSGGRASEARFQEKAGIIPISVQYDETGSPSWIKMSQPLPSFGPRFDDARAIAELLSLEEKTITDTKFPIEVVSCGVPFLFVPLRDLRAIREIKFRLDVWETVLKNFAAPHVFVFTQEVERRGSGVHCRMFAPGLGIFEDPATGGASGPLGCYLAKNGVLKASPATDIISEQGFEMGRPSIIRVTIDQEPEGRISGVAVSGQCRSIGEGYIHLA